MKLQLTIILLLGLFVSVQAKVQRARKMVGSDMSQNVMPSNQYEIELNRLKSEIRSKEDQLSRIAQEINKLKETEVKTSAMFDIAKKDSIRKNLDDNPIEVHDNANYLMKRSRMQYACRK